MSEKFFLRTTDRRTGIDDARKYAAELVEFAPNDDARERVARALTYVPPGLLELLQRDGTKINIVTLDRQVRDVSPIYPFLDPRARDHIDRGVGLYVSVEKRVYLRAEALEHPAGLVHELGHAVDAAVLRDRARRDPDRYPDTRTLSDVGGEIINLPRQSVSYLSHMGLQLPGYDREGDALESAWMNSQFVSEYASELREEMFAEAFRGMCGTGTPEKGRAYLGPGTTKNVERIAPSIVGVINGLVSEYEAERQRGIDAVRATEPKRGDEAPAEERGKRDFRQEITEKIIAQLEAGKIPWEKPWEFTLPFNATRGNQYHGINQLILMLTAQEQKWNDPRWMTFKQAADKGWAVRKGERSTMIEYWKPPEKLTQAELSRRFDEAKKRDPQLDFDSFAKDQARQANRWQVFYARVFNAAQIDVPTRDEKGDVVKELVEIDGKQVERAAVTPLTRALPWAKRAQEIPPVERIEKLLAATGARFEYGGGQAYYSPSRDVIVIPSKGTFKSLEGYESTRLHELGHWTGHPSRLDRSELQAHPFGSEGYAKEELRAELASVFLSAETGIPYDVTQHAAYVQSWVKALRDDKNEIFRASKDAEKITDYVLAFENERAREIEGERGHGGDRDAGMARAPRDRAAEERMWIAGRAQSLVLDGVSPLDASKQATWESQQYSKAEAEGLSPEDAWRRVNDSWASFRGAESHAPEAIEKINLSSLPVATIAGALREAERIPYDFTARVNGRDAEGEHVIATLGGKQVAIGRQSFSEVPVVGEVVEVKRAGDVTTALTERQAEIAANESREIEVERDAAFEVA